MPNNLKRLHRIKLSYTCLYFAEAEAEEEGHTHEEEVPEKDYLKPEDAASTPSGEGSSQPVDEGMYHVTWS